MTRLARLALSLSPLILMILGSSFPATAALKRYEMKRQQVSASETRSPRVEFLAFPGITGVGLLDESGADPILRRFVMGDPGSSQTVVIPALGGFAWFSFKTTQGPGPDQTGTGSSASSIDWANVSSWTTTGGSFCHSVPSFLCGIVNFIDNETIPAMNASTNYDFGQWLFHGTGFTNPDGRIIFTNPDVQGNTMYFERGSRRDTGVVPALPLIGIACVGLSITALGFARHSRKK